MHYDRVSSYSIQLITQDWIKWEGDYTVVNFVDSVQEQTSIVSGNPYALGCPQPLWFW